MSTAVEQTAHYCSRYAVFCTGANERGECETTVCWNSQRLFELLKGGNSQWLSELLKGGDTE